MTGAAAAEPLAVARLPPYRTVHSLLVLYSLLGFEFFLRGGHLRRPKAAVRRTRGEVVAVMAVLPNRWLVFDVGLVLLIIYYAFPASATSGTAAVERRSTGLVTDAAPVSAPAWSLQDPRKSVGADRARGSD